MNDYGCYLGLVYNENKFKYIYYDCENSTGKNDMILPIYDEKEENYE